jgi:hypothetical protein
MSAIAATGSPSSYSAVARLLADSLPSATAGLPQTGPSGTSGSSAAGKSAPDSLNLSDHAKSVLARAKSDQVAADQLQAFLQSAKNPNGTGKTPASSQASGDAGAQILARLKGQTQSQQGDSKTLSLADLQRAEGSLSGLGAYEKALSDASLQPDGTSRGYSQTLHDVIVVPSTPQDIATWYQTDGKSLLSAAQAWPDEDPGLAEALASHAVTFLNAKDIPDLNFHNTIVIQGGEGGGSANELGTFNQKAAAILSTTTTYKVLASGTVLAWKTPPSTSPAPSNWRSFAAQAPATLPVKDATSNLE